MSGNKFGGERLESASALSKNNLLEHLARYNLVESMSDGRVLDLGCGSGHGSKRLSEKFTKVTALDVSQQALDYAKDNFFATNIDYVLASGDKMPFEDNCFDTVVAFEVFEHVSNWRGLLSEIKRVAKPNSKIYISTPNKDLYSPGTSKPINPHHAFEMTESEFKAALKEFFILENFYGQRTPIYNDHWIWSIVNPILFAGKNIFSYKFNNTAKLKIINWIKPVLNENDIVFKADESFVKKSRFFLAVCKNNK